MTDVFMPFQQSQLPASRQQSMGSLRMRRRKSWGSTITVVIVDEDRNFRRGLAERLEADWGFAVLAVEADAQRAIAVVKELKPDLLLTDLRLPDVFSMLIAASYKSPCTRPMLMCSAFLHREILEGLYRGALGVWMKDRPELMEEALSCVASGGCWLRNREVQNVTSLIREIESDSAYSCCRLTPREQDVVLLTAFGLTNRDIGARLNIKENTVKRHMTNMFEKFGASSRTELTRLILEHGMIRNGMISKTLSGGRTPTARPRMTPPRAEAGNSHET
jgi:DNA-binding NarL/FixJ family response regulator